MVSLYLLILWDEGDVEVIGRPSLGFAAKVPDDIMVNIVMVMIIMIAMLVMIIIFVMMVIIMTGIIVMIIMIVMMVIIMPMMPGKYQLVSSTGQAPSSVGIPVFSSLFSRLEMIILFRGLLCVMKTCNM